MQIVSIGSTDLPELSIEMQQPECNQATEVTKEANDLRAAYFEYLAISLEAQRTKQPFYLH